MYEVNDTLILKKPHPCGGKKWRVVRVGADIKLQCSTCGRYLNIARDDLKKSVKEIKKDGE